MAHLASLRSALIALALAPAWAWAGPFAGPIGTITMLDGSAQIVRDTLRFKAVEGQRVQAEDLVLTADETRLLRVEFSDGSVLDLGAATQAQLQPRPLGERQASVYLASGWAKLAQPAGQAGAGIASPRLDLSRLAGAAVMRVEEGRGFVFVETGQAELLERAPAHPLRALALHEGQTFSLQGAQAGAVLARPSAALMKGLPRAFADQLPRRAARFQSAQVELGPLSQVLYADVARFINAEAALRPVFVQRFAPLAKDRPFRAGLLAELRSHPEWTRVLFPDKPRVKGTALARRGAGPAALEAAVVAHPTTTPAALTDLPTVSRTPLMGGLPMTAALAERAAERAN